MPTVRSAAWLSELTLPLLSKFGGLTLLRDGDAVRWNYAGDSALVELRTSDCVAARFIARPAADGRSGEAVSAVYAPRNATYPLTRPGVERMVDDLTQFFSGVREPRFAFVDAFVEGAAS